MLLPLACCHPRCGWNQHPHCHPSRPHPVSLLHHRLLHRLSARRQALLRRWRVASQLLRLYLSLLLIQALPEPDQALPRRPHPLCPPRRRQPSLRFVHHGHHPLLHHRHAHFSRSHPLPHHADNSLRSMPQRREETCTGTRQQVRRPVNIASPMQDKLWRLAHVHLASSWNQSLP